MAKKLTYKDSGVDIDAANRFRVGPSEDNMQTAATRLGMTPLFV